MLRFRHLNDPTDVSFGSYAPDSELITIGVRGKLEGDRPQKNGVKKITDPAVFGRSPKGAGAV